jgi:hypothetical protein
MLKFAQSKGASSLLSGHLHYEVPLINVSTSMNLKDFNLSKVILIYRYLLREKNNSYVHNINQLKAKMFIFCLF